MQSSHQQPTQVKEKDDFMLSGIFFTFGLLAVVGILVYLLTIQTNAQKCEPKFGEKGEIINNCPPAATKVSPTKTPGQIEFLPNMNQQQKIPQLDGR